LKLDDDFQTVFDVPERKEKKTVTLPPISAVTGFAAALNFSGGSAGEIQTEYVKENIIIYCL
jgi:hypothetical protein